LETGEVDVGLVSGGVVEEVADVVGACETVEDEDLEVVDADNVIKQEYPLEALEGRWLHCEANVGKVVAAPGNV
jgi:hypothetical protein